MQFMANGSEMCVSWDFGMQQWTSDGCNTSVGQGGIITCRCNHLTNFAVLVVGILLGYYHIHVEIIEWLIDFIVPWT